MDRRQHIAVVDDHQDIRELLARYLGENGYRVSVAPTAEAFRRELAKEIPDLIVLDIMMPGEDGISLCRYLYAEKVAPVIFLTAVATDVDRIVGLELGADDYLTKPFNPRELLARIKAVLRRVGSGEGGGKSGGASMIRFESQMLDVAKREITGPDGVAVPLSTAEFKLLMVFLQQPGEVLSRDFLLKQTVGRGGDFWDRSIDNQISRLRRKVEPDPKNPTLIKTQWGDGYIFTGRVSEA